MNQAQNIFEKDRTVKAKINIAKLNHQTTLISLLHFKTMSVILANSCPIENPNHHIEKKGFHVRHKYINGKPWN